jgi:2-C-methyl-D-erythritol 4-phosphate cytidylyltransferase
MRSRAPAVTAVIAAAGSGERLGAGGPKAFVPVAGRPMIAWSIEAFRACGSVGSIVVAAPPGVSHDLGGGDLVVVDGGATRAESVAHALEAVGTELVAIHDAARPLLTPALVADLVDALEAMSAAAGVIAAVPLTDTVKRSCSPRERARSPSPADGAGDALLVAETLDRAQLWAAQTPQLFRVEALREALMVEAEARDAATDESMLVEAAGGTVLLHPAPAANIKVTTPQDLRLAELLLAERSALS